MSPLFIKAAVDLAVGQALGFENFRSPNKVQEISNRTTNGFSNPLIGNDGRIYACSGHNFYAFDGNGSIAWVVSLNYRCRLDVAPVGGERGEIFLIAEDRVLRIDPSNVGTSSSAVEVFYGPESSNKGSVFVSQTRVEAKTGQLIGEYEYISATKPIDLVFTMLIPATGTVYWTEKYPGPLSSLLSETDLRYFALDERITLALVAAASQKLTWSCSQAKPKYLSIYTGEILLHA
ncbi:Protein GAMETE EXPRESSED 3 [Acorus gramineus]|uniref:Protein GAMETE EXPRESSED 3 n=1 Tax=Acorus gramineus TaxID=55184 RepID=A0AAV9BVI1_ACOGR|nr:Protein GAMETE EXPRESSED 3 [Acorus gramineus]